jgi:serine/threonine protein kinase
MSESVPDEQAANAAVTPSPQHAADTGGISGVLFPHTPPTIPGTVVDITTLASRPVEDLSGEQLLRVAPRMNVRERMVPALGGIPLLAKLGQGGMGAVYYGVHPRLHLEVAVKVLASHLSFQNPSAVERFFREARTAARVKSAHLVMVLDVNEEQGLHYLVMEFVRGVSAGAHMKQVLAQGARGLTEAVALDLCIAATQGLSAAHEEGIIHRDIKPDNILIPVSKDGRELRMAEAKLADLGLARAEEGEQGLTASQVALGTPGYMAPEQAMDSKLTGKASDVFSVGATLYAFLAGRAPFSGSSFIQVLMATAHEAHAPIGSVRPEVSPATAALLDRCLSKEPGNRYTDALALLEALRACRAALAQDATLIIPAVVTAIQGARAPGVSKVTPAVPSVSTPPLPASAPVSPALAPLTSPAVPVRRGRWVAILLVLLLLGGVLGTLFVLDRRSAQTVAGLLEEVEPARRADEAPVNAAIARIEDFREDFIGRDAVLQPAVERLSELTERSEQLAGRKSEFLKLIDQARAQATDRPDETLELLDRAEDLGDFDEEKAWPDLTTARRGELDDLRKQATKAIQRRVAAESAEKRLREFEVAYQAGAGHWSRGEVNEAAQVLTQAFSSLGDMGHVARNDAAALLVKAKTEIQRREWAGSQLKQAEKCLLDGQLDEAAVLFRQARESWPGNPDAKRIDEGLRAVSANLYARNIAAGRKALDQKDWMGAERSFLAALKERKDDAAALAGLKEARGHNQDSRYSQAMEQAYRALQFRKWSEAGQLFQQALALRKEDPAALQGIQDAQTGARDELFFGLLRTGQDALKAGQWDRATASYKEALNLRRSDTEALQGLQRAALQRTVRISLTRVVEGYVKVKGLRERGEAQMAGLARQAEQDRAEVERLSRETRPGGKRRPFEHLRNLKELGEARVRLAQSMQTLKEQSDRMKLNATQEVLMDIASAASELARRQPYYLVLQFDTTAEVTAQNFQPLADYSGQSTPEQMLATFRRNLIIHAPEGFSPAAVLVPAADLSKAAVSVDDITDQLIRTLNDAYNAGLEKRAVKRWQKANP